MSARTVGGPLTGMNADGEPHVRTFEASIKSRLSGLWPTLPP
jgi:hypothetical protein